MSKEFLFKYSAPPAGSYIKSRLHLALNDIHLKNLKLFIFNRKTNNFLYEINELEDRLELIFLTKLPPHLDEIPLQDGTKSAMLFQDILDVPYQGNVKEGYIYLDNPLPLDGYNEISDLTWTYPQAAIMDLIDFIHALSYDILTQGFQEALLIGPEIVEIKDEK